MNLGIAISLKEADNTQSINLILKESSQDSQLYAGIVKDLIYSSTLPNESLAQTEVINENTNARSVFYFIAPGLIIYGLLILIPGIAESFSKITDKNYIFRFANSRAKSWHIIFGTVLYYLLISLIQLLILYFTAIAFGYNANGNILFAIPAALLTGLFVIGVGLLIGGFVKKSEAATNLGVIISIIFGFFSGSFIAGIGNVLKFDLFENTILLTDSLPSKWGTDAVKKILSNNLGLSDITKELLIIGISSLIIILIGIYIYQKRQLRAE